MAICASGQTRSGSPTPWKDRDAVRRMVEGAGLQDDPDYRDYVGATDDDDREAAYRSLQATMVRSQALARANAPTSDREAAARIKSGPLFHDAGPGREQNAFAKWLNDLIKRLFDGKSRAPAVGGPITMASRVLSAIVWLLIIGFVIAILVFALRRMTWRRRLDRKARAALTEDEPERSRDEWLELADSLAAEGRHREAVRALYIACLLRFDETRVARFDRSQTNWEHLHRFETSARRPAGIDFRFATRRFDRIWYGGAPCSADDVAEFRRLYSSIPERPVEVAA